MLKIPNPKDDWLSIHTDISIANSGINSKWSSHEGTSGTGKASGVHILWSALRAI